MGKGLSPLQREILAVLPALKDQPPAVDGYVSLRGWARPRDILDALRRKPTPANRVAISKALDRLWKRDLIVGAQGQIRTQGSGYRYARQ